MCAHFNVYDYPVFDNNHDISDEYIFYELNVICELNVNV